MKTSIIELEGKTYEIKLKTFGRVAVNGTNYYLRSLPHRNALFIPMEYDLPIPEGQVMLAAGMFSTQLIVNGINHSNGKPYTPISKVPPWAYIFAVLDFTMCLGGGAIPAMLAVIAFFMTLRISTMEDYPIGVRLLLSVVILVGGWLLLLILAALISLVLF